MNAALEMAGLLIHTVRVWRPELTDDGAGGSTQDLVQVGADIRGRLEPVRLMRPREVMSGARSDLDFDHVLFAQAGTDIRRGDRFALSSDLETTYRVVEVAEPSHMGHHLEVMSRLEVDS